MEEQIRKISSQTLSNLTKDLIPDLKQQISKIATPYIDLIKKTMLSGTSPDKDGTPVLKFNKPKEEEIKEIYSSYSSYLSNDNVTIQTTSACMILFKILKSFAVSVPSDETKQYINEILKSKIEDASSLYLPYLNFFFNYDTSTVSSVSDLKNEYNNSINQFEQITEQKNRFLSLKDSKEILNIIFNPLSFIHYLEYSIELSSNDFPSNDIPNHILFLMKYHKCLTLAILFYQVNNVAGYNEIINRFVKALIVLSIQIIVNEENVPLELIEKFLSLFITISFELTVNSNEIYLFSLISSLIIYSKFPNINREIFKSILDSPQQNEVLKYINPKTNELDITLNSVKMLLIDALVFCFNKKYKRNLEQIRESIKCINVDDFVMGNMFLYSEVYDHLTLTIKNFKEKLYWNFCELCNIILVKEFKFPKILKMIVMKQLQNVPNNNSLIYNLIQFYFSNKNYRKAKILCRKVIGEIDYTKEAEAAKVNQIEEEIKSNVLLIFAKINVIEENYKQAKDLCILNVKMLEGNINLPLISRANVLLGITYKKLAAVAMNYEERLNKNEMAKRYFEIGYKNSPKNEKFAYYFAHQLFILRKYDDCESFLNALEVKQTLNFIELKVVCKIALMKYDDALEICRKNISKFGKEKNILYLNVLYILYYYVKLYKIINLSFDKNYAEDLVTEMIKTLKSICTEITNQISILSQKNSEQSSSQESENLIKKIYKNDLKKTSFAPSKTYLTFEKKSLESFRLSFLKNFSYLSNYLYDNDIDTSEFLLHKAIGEAYDMNTISNEDVNGLLIKGIFNKIEDKNAESYFEKLFEIKQSHLMGLKIYSKYLLNQKKDYQKCFIFCMKALKIDSHESQLYDILGKYYQHFGDDNKFYECAMKEVENRKYHTNSFLRALINDDII